MDRQRKQGEATELERQIRFMPIRFTTLATTTPRRDNQLCTEVRGHQLGRYIRQSTRLRR